MSDRLYLLIPLGCAWLYASGALLMKVAQHRGVGALRITVLANVATALGFLFYYPWERGLVIPDPWWPVAAAGVTFALGQMLTILAFSRGRVSVATPALGTKALLVTLLVWAFLDQDLSWAVWLAAVAMVVGLAVLVGRKPTGAGGEVVSVVLSLLAALAFASFDVLIRYWSVEGRLGFGVVAPYGIAIATLLSLPIAAFDRTPLRGAVPTKAWRSLVPGVALNGLQSMIFIWFIGDFGLPAQGNIVYGSRGIWGVVLVWVLGRWFGQVERFHTPGLLVRRLVGATLMTVGVALVFLKG